MKVSLLKKGFCPKQELLQQAVLRMDNYPIVMLGQRIDSMVYPGYYSDNGVTARVLWSSHIGKALVTALVEATPENLQREIHILLRDTPQEVEGEILLSSKYYSVGITPREYTVEVEIYAADLWTPYEALMQ